MIAGEVAEELFARLAWMTIKPTTVLSVGNGDEVSLRLQQCFPEAEILSQRLPSAESSVDVIFANMALPWQADNKKIFQSWRRMLRPNGLLIFSTLGLDTLKECQAIFGDALPSFVDMHDVGDDLLEAGFSDPVLDVDYFTTVYRSKEKLIAELCASGMLGSEPDAVQIDQLIATDDQAYELTYEIVFAHAFAPLQSDRSVTEDGVVKVPLSQLRRSL